MRERERQSTNICLRFLYYLLENVWILNTKFGHKEISQFRFRFACWLFTGMMYCDLITISWYHGFCTWCHGILFHNATFLFLFIRTVDCLCFFLILHQLFGNKELLCLFFGLFFFFVIFWILLYFVQCLVAEVAVVLKKIVSV